MIASIIPQFCCNVMFILKLAWQRLFLDLLLSWTKLVENVIYTPTWHHQSFVGMDSLAYRLFTSLLLHHLPSLPPLLSISLGLPLFLSLPLHHNHQGSSSSSVFLFIIIGIPPHCHRYSSSSSSLLSLVFLFRLFPKILKDILLIRCL